MARRSQRHKRNDVLATDAPRRRSVWSGVASASVAAILLVAALWLASDSGWLPFGRKPPRPEVSLVPSRTGIPLPPGPGGVAVFEPAPTASGKSEASAAVFECISRLHVNNDVLQPLRRDLDYQIWPNPEFRDDAKSARYLFRLRQQVIYSADGPRLIAEIRACTAQP